MNIPKATIITARSSSRRYPNKILENIVKKGHIILDINLNIDDKGKINNITQLEKDQHLISLNIGLEDPKDLINDIKKSLKFIK